MKKLLLIAALMLAATIGAVAQEIINDTIVRGVRYAMFTDKSGDVVAYRSAVPFDEHQAVIDLNNRFRNTAVYSTVSASTAIAGSLLLGFSGIHRNQNAFSNGDPKWECDHPTMATFGVAASVTSLVFGIMSWAQLWTPRLYVNQDGLVFRLDGKKTKYYRHEFNEKDDE